MSGHTAGPRNKAPIGSRWRFKTDDKNRVFVVIDRKPGGVVEYMQEDLAVFGSCYLRDWLRNAEFIGTPAKATQGAEP